VVRQPALPLWRHVVFVDWHGVLSRSPFWASIVTDPRHPLNRPLRAKLGRLLGDQVLMGDWMTGRRSTADVVAGMGVEGGVRYGTDYLCRQLEKDCRAMRVNVDLLRALQPVRERAFVVVATDNVDSFADVYRRLAARPHPRVVRVPDAEPVPGSGPAPTPGPGPGPGPTPTTGEAPTAGSPPDADDSLATWATSWDDLVCSSDVGVLKGGDPHAFFGPYLAACGLGFADALLIDDRSDNCAAFRSMGGTALRWTMHTDPLADVRGVIENWLGAAVTASS
jgi:hypothetical protein